MAHPVDGQLQAYIKGVFSMRILTVSNPKTIPIRNDNHNPWTEKSLDQIQLVHVDGKHSCIQPECRNNKLIKRWIMQCKNQVSRKPVVDALSGQTLSDEQ